MPTAPDRPRFGGAHFTPAAARTLRLLADAGGPLTSRDVAESLGIGATSAHMRLVRLEDAGYVERAFADGDRAARYAWSPVGP